MQAAVESPQSALRCIVCGATTASTSAKRARVHSNVKRFREESFDLWQCPNCASIHAATEVDLDYYYAHYPFHAQRISAGTRLMFANKLRLLEKFGMRRGERVLDYGAGGGAFVTFLNERGYPEARGYDPYVSEGKTAVQPTPGNDVVLSQDVIEHVADPREHLTTLRDLSRPGGLIVIGTPNAAVVSLERADEFVHVLHQPYHRHILSADTLRELAVGVGLSLVGVKPGFFGNRAIPGMNGRFMRRMLRVQGETIDDLIAGKAPLHWRLFTPAAIWDALTGSFRDEGYDMLIAFRVAG
jgi:2-polyprenyl-3-methyl-5-hydroxy-6-metoxy-1,4-benzoquinol methylase